MKWLDRYSDHAYALLRIMAGIMFSFHGAQKLFGVLGGAQPPMASQLWFAGIIELLGGLAVMLGFETRVAAFICSGEMAVAYFQVHWKFQLDPQFFPIVNHGELALLYCFLFLFIASKGTVKWGLMKRG
ncbi:MAG: DoxX family protein [Candidatus Aminicenantes bacterium]|nr:MAG: DoxX family protein [Candidatus Aminicenantes bacterium]